ncbi:MAG TPA: carboxypeptidase regulatory-like domain-containing protein [Terriglobia bacterium]|nr:carboxypeptidase regulatory-like domain-containing protein [Terriglobia bacterium]
MCSRKGVKDPRNRQWMRVVIYRIPLILIAVLAVVPLAWSQDASLVGTVTDPSGAVIANVSIAVKNLETGVENKVMTDESGRYLIKPLSVGHYSLTATASGFRTVNIPDIPLTLKQIGVMDVRMEVGEISEKVTVTAETTMLQAEQSAIGQTIENKAVLDLPLNGRDFVQLVTITPGATMDGNEYETGNTRALINGQRSSKTTSTIDGVLNIDQLFSGFPISPSIDSIEEFRVQSGNFSAEQGNAPSNVSVRLKSGTNSFHGSAFEFLRNNVFDARNFFQSEVSALRQNQFGGTFGGPIRKDKMFFFAAYDGTRQRSPADFSVTVPTVAMRQGNFAGMSPIIDPLTGNPFPNNQIPDDRINKVAKYFMPDFPEPNSGNQYVYSTPNQYTVNQVSGRFDYYARESDRFFVSYSFNQRRIFEADPLPAVEGYIRQGRAQRAVVNWNHTLSATKLNNFTLGWARFRNVIDPAVWGGTNFTVESGLQGFDQTSSTYPGFPGIGIGGYQGIDAWHWFPLINPTTNWQISDDFSVVHGGHQLRVGTDLRRFVWYSQSATLSRGDLYYSGDYTGNGWADFLLGNPVSAFRQFPQCQYNQLSYNLAWYFQDNWRITPNLTLDLGLRYEYDTWPVDDHNQVTSFDQASGKFAVGHADGQDPDLSVQPTAPLAWKLYQDMLVKAADVGLPNRSLRFPDKNNWAPRFGLAWRPSFLKETVLRLGYGIFYELHNGNNNSDFTATSIPWIIGQSVYNTKPVPTLDNQHLFPPGDAGWAAGVQPIVFDPHARIPYMQEWNVAVQKQLNPNTSVEVAYVGNSGNKLETRVPFNRPLPGAEDASLRRLYPDLGEGYAERNLATSSYQALQAKFERRFEKGLMLIASYTWAKSIDMASSDFGSGIQDAINYRGDRGLSDFDYPHRLTVAYVWDLPFGKGKRFLSNASGPAQWILGGWETTGLVTLQSGTPFSVYSGLDVANTYSWPQRANRIRSGQLDNPTIDKWFDTEAFVMPADYTWGNAGRNILRTDGTQLWDAGMMKNFEIREGLRLQFRFEFFNVLNHPNFGGPDNYLNDSPSYGGNGNFGKVFYTSTGPRVGQVALKIYF